MKPFRFGWLLLLLCAAGVRLAGLSTEFWLDEIWSLTLASSLHSPLEVLTRLHHDNNHYLNTLLMYCLGEKADWRWYRLLSLLTGAASVPLAAAIARRGSEAAAWAAGLLVGFSYPLVVYSSEARGYAPMVFFALLCFYFMERRGKRDPAFFSAAAALGFLSHLTFIHFYLAALVLSFLRLRGSARELLRWHLAPWLFIAWLYWTDIRLIQIGGGTEAHPVSGALELALGAPGLCLFALLFLFRAEWNERSEYFFFYAAAIVAAPALLLGLRQPHALFSRYFLVPIVFFLMMLAGWLGRIHQKRRGLYWAVLALVCAGNAFKIFHFLADGRGHYAEAVQYMMERGGGPGVTVGSDHDFRNLTVLKFYISRGGSDSPITYVSRGAAAAPDWRIIHTFDPRAVPDAAVSDAAGRRYVFEKAFRHWGLSGWTWLLYRKAAA